MNYLVRDLITIIVSSPGQMMVDGELVSVQFPVLTLIRQLPDLGQDGARQPHRHLVLGQQASLGTLVVIPGVVDPLVGRCEEEEVTSRSR